MRHWSIVQQALLAGITLEFSGRQKAQLFDGPLERLVMFVVH